MNAQKPPFAPPPSAHTSLDMKMNPTRIHPRCPSPRVDSGRPGLTVLLLIALLLAFAAPAAFAAATPPAYISYQGYLTDANGAPLSQPTTVAGGTGPENYSIQFRLYASDATADTDVLWSEKQTVTVDNGAFSVLLGEGDSIAADNAGHATFTALFDSVESGNLYVGITVIPTGDSSGSEIAPRLRLVSSPYAMLAATAVRADQADTLGDGTTSAISFDGSTVSLSKPLADTSVSGTLDVDKAATLKAGATVTGDSTFNGKIGIGSTTAPSKTLDVTGTFKASGAATLGSSLTVVGNVGINNTSPGKTLDVTGTFQASGAATLQSTLTVDGKLGVGTTSPVSKLHVYDTGTPILLLQSGATSGRAWGIESGSDGKLDFTDFTAVKNRLTIDTSGFVYVPQRLGIGTTDLDATTPLIVSSVEHADFNDSGRIDGNGNSSNGNLIKDAQLSIWANGGIRTPVVYLSSDARIKSVIGRTPEAAALETINKLRVTDYRMRDSVVQGTSPRRGFIAQEVEAILPTAVTQRKGIVPDVYQSSESVRFQERERTLSVAVKKPHGLSKGDWVRLIHDRKAETFEIVSIPGDTQFVVAGWETPVEKVFVYGRQVEDLRSVNYEQIFATGIAAIQEVNRKLDASNKQLQSEVATIRGENARLNELLASVVQRLQTLESFTQ